MTGPERVLALRLAAPLQSWGGRSSFNRRETRAEPTKSGVLGLLAAASGIRRDQQITHLLGLRLGVRTDQPGSLLRDYHTAADYRGNALPSTDVNAKGLQKPTSPAKPTYVTERFYLQDAVFVAALAGPGPLIDALAQALRAPHFPLALGRRSCPPAGPVLLDIYDAGLEETLDTIVPWQATTSHRRRHERDAVVRVPATIEHPDGHDALWDVPNSFSLRSRAFGSRRVRHEWITLPTGHTGDRGAEHDPFDLLGG